MSAIGNNNTPPVEKRYIFAGLLVSPVSYLRHLDNAPPSVIIDARQRLAYLPEILHLTFSDTTDPTYEQLPETKEEEETYRIKLGEMRCIVTGTIDPDICRILPIESMVSCFEKLRRSKSCFDALWPIFPDRAKKIKWEYKPEGNMLCLSPQLHRWWCKAYFGFKCSKILRGSTRERKILRLTLYWMPRRGFSGPQERDYILRYMADTLGPLDGVAAYRKATATTGDLIQSGDMFAIEVDADLAPQMKKELDYQWTLVRIAALTRPPTTHGHVVVEDSADGKG
ncbi:hypothetical protein QBC47DRAFT_357631 [Echria macrotheca]|uniref:Uncharacterized protein n=1 Tax=Echria macrotheca TaxID=438768 RepID=A0AAJ0BK83_9PEZI|nr:hypothetical protein QBC47DRAFT_357631 [Echria macrotheca]